jgi:hypothetical protein
MTPVRNFSKTEVTPLQKNLLEVSTLINRLQSEKTALRNKMEKNTATERRARTRTLIQIGSLIKLVGLAQLCDIEEGDDLQLDIESRDKAALLLGILTDVVADFSPTPAQEERWRDAGIRQLKILASNKIASK